jgi:hypothetical protein
VVRVKDVRVLLREEIRDGGRYIYVVWTAG